MASPQREQQQLVAEIFALFRSDNVPIGIDGGDSSLPELAAGRLDQRPEREPLHLADPKRLRNRGR